MKKIAYPLLVGAFILSLFHTSLNAQYLSEIVLEKSFEREDFFFTPTELTPYGLASFTSVAAGVFSNPILDYYLNPATAWKDSTQQIYGYIDFRSIHNVAEESYGIVPLVDNMTMRSDLSYIYPIYYSERYQKTQPFFAGAIFWRLPSIFGRRPVLGGTYRMIYQDENYYAIPFDVYRSSVGMDYSGARLLDENLLPTIDRYRGEDKLNRSAHFASFFASTELFKHLNFGARVSYANFDRDGKFGSHNFWNDISNSSLWENWEWRDQNYNHWDYSAGLTYVLNDRFQIGTKYGILKGNATQHLGNSDSSYYNSEYQTDNWWHGISSGNSSKNWYHDGDNRYMGVDVRAKISPTLSAVFYFEQEKAKIDLVNSAMISDSQSGSSHYAWEQNVSDHEYSYFLSDTRSGTGNKSFDRISFAAFGKWELEAGKSLSFGLQYEKYRQKIKTSENVLSHRYSYSKDINSNPNYGDHEYLNQIDESKVLIWDFQAQRQDIRIPLVFQWQFMPSAELLIGINRTMSRWTIDDVTYARFNYREETVNDNTERKENFIERYILPQEKRTDIRTTLLAGITFKPVQNIRAQLLAVPVFEDRYGGSELSYFEVWINLDILR